MHVLAHKTRMNTLKRIRVDVFDVRQPEMARIAGVSQSTVSRWEKGEFTPGIEPLRNLRKAALERGLPWDDALILESPSSSPSEPGA